MLCGLVGRRLKSVGRRVYGARNGSQVISAKEPVMAIRLNPYIAFSDGKARAA